MEPRKDSLPGVDADEPTVRSTMPTREPSFLHSPGIVPPGAPDSEAEINYSLHNRCNSQQQEDILVITSRETKSVNQDAEIKSHKSPSPGPTPLKEIIDSYQGTSQLPPHLNRHGQVSGTPSSAPPPPPIQHSAPPIPTKPPVLEKQETNPVFSRQPTLASISEEKKFGKSGSLPTFQPVQINQPPLIKVRDSSNRTESLKSEVEYLKVSMDYPPGQKDATYDSPSKQKKVLLEKDDYFIFNSTLLTGVYRLLSNWHFCSLFFNPCNFIHSSASNFF